MSGSTDALKTHYGLQLNRFAQKKVADVIQVLGKALPARVVAVAGSIVTVAFEVTSAFTLPTVTMPMFGPEYIRYPTQVGDLGVVFPADARLGGISGLGAGVADLSLPANLSALVWFPIASKHWTATENPNAVVIYGPDGAVLRDTASRSVITLTPGGVSIVLQSGDKVAITGDLSVTGSITAGFGGADRVGLQTHDHIPGPAPTPGT